MRGSEIPQADSLPRVRRLVESVVRRPSISMLDAGSAAGLSPRHSAYYAAAAQTLKLVRASDTGLVATPLGERLVSTTPHTSEEGVVWRDAIFANDIVRAIAPDLLTSIRVSKNALAHRIEAQAQLAPSTAHRRAGTLTSWRDYVLALLDDSQLALEASPTSADASGLTDPPPQSATRLTKLALEDFKGYRRASLGMSRFTVVIGTNASGKSNLRDAFRFLHGIARGYTIPEIIGEKWIEGGVPVWRGIRGGTREATWQRAGHFAIEVGIELTDRGTRRPATYRIQVEVPHDGHPPKVMQERLVVEGRGQFIFDSHPESNPIIQDDPVHLFVRLKKAPKKGFVGRTIQVINNQPAITQLAQHKDVQPQEVKEFAALTLDAFRSMRFLDLSPDQMRLPSLPGQVTLGDRGENLSSVLQAICQRSSTKGALIKWLRELTPLDVVDFRFPADQTGRVLATLVEEGGQETSAYSASDGTLRFLAMIAAFLGPDPAQFYFFEELETGLHPTRLHLLLNLIERQTDRGRTQVVATTHSPTLLTFLSTSAVASTALTYRKAEETEQKIVRIMDLPRARRVLKTQDLAQLYASGWLEDAVTLSGGSKTPQDKG